MKLSYRNSDVEKNVPDIDSMYGAEIQRKQSLSQIDWKTLSENIGRRFRIIVENDRFDLPLDVLYIPRKSNRLLVGLHGAEPGNENLPKFQFVRSFESERDESLLFISDSTHLLELGKMPICWYVGTENFDLCAAYANLIEDLASKTDINHTLLVGHSAGGAGALKIAPKSKTLEQYQ